MSSQESSQVELEAWLGPVSIEAPSGIDPRDIPAYEALRDEIAKLESPTLGACRWEKVELDASRVLAQSKDLASAAYLACALSERRGIEGLLLGTVLLGELLQKYQELHPSRPRARANALAFFLERAEQQAGCVKPRASDRSGLAELALAIGTLRTAITDRLGVDGPSAHRFADAVQRLTISLPPEERSNPPRATTGDETLSNPPPSDGLRAEDPSPRPDTSLRPASLPESPANPAKVPQFLGQIGIALCASSQLVRGSNPLEPEGMRLFLAGLYLPVTQLPTVLRDRRMGLKGPPEALRSELERWSRDGEPRRLLEMAFRELEKHRFWLDLHRALHDALGALGPSAADARTIHEHELRALMGRLPGLSELEFSDGKPCAGADTRQWIDSWSRVPTASAALLMDSDESTLDNARAQLRAGKTKDALSTAQGAVRHATDARARFVARLELAALALEGKVKGIGTAIAGELVRDALARDLADWDPALVARAYALYLRAVAEDPTPGAQLPFSRAEIHGRLSVLDPVAAASAI